MHDSSPVVVTQGRLRHLRSIVSRSAFTLYMWREGRVVGEGGVVPATEVAPGARCQDDEERQEKTDGFCSQTIAR